MSDEKSKDTVLVINQKPNEAKEGMVSVNTTFPEPEVKEEPKEDYNIDITFDAGVAVVNAPKPQNVPMKPNYEEVKAPVVISQKPTRKNMIPNNTPGTIAETIWNEIKDKDVFMFSLPSKKVSQMAQPVLIDPSRCFITYSAATSFLPALEAAIGNKYVCETVQKYIVISRAKQNV